VTDPAPRLRSCVRCGAILQASDTACPSCRSAQPAPGAPRPTESRAPPGSPVRRAVGPLIVVAMLAAAGLGLYSLNNWLSGRAGRAATQAAAADAVHLTLEGREIGSEAFDRAAGAGVELDLQRELEYYDVEGTSAGEIFDAIDARGPDSPDGKAVGLTRLQSGTYLYASDARSGRCVVTSLGATLTITLPRLTTTPLPEQTYERWKDYSRAVAEHEQRHADIYAEAAGRVADRLEAAQPFADRAAMEAAFTAAWSEEMAVAERENREFHGQEARAVAFEREIVTNEIRRVERELEAETDRVRYAALLTERAGLIERGLWLH
jgi:predicted secreted Zn-dependent protease